MLYSYNVEHGTISIEHSYNHSYNTTVVCGGGGGGGYVYVLYKIHNTSMSIKQLCGSEAILSDSKVETKDNTISFYKYCKF